MFMIVDLKDVWVWIQNAVRGLLGSLCEAIYPLIADSYNLFLSIGKLVYNDEFRTIYNKISLLIGIFMVFRVTFWLIELMVNPDAISDKEKKPGEIIKKVLLSVVLLAITPRIFYYAGKLQYIIVDEGIIEKIILPSSKRTDVNIGNQIAANLFVSFYQVNEEPETLSLEDPGCSLKTESVYTSLLEKGKLNKLNSFCLTARYRNKGTTDIKNGNEYNPYIIDFNGLFAVGVGAVVLWMIVMYCISVGARFIQMIFLQIIAPIPIMCNLVPGKDNMFTKWVKQCTTTYLDLFIRIAIISFVLLMCNMVLGGQGIFSQIVDQNGKPNFWINIFLVLGLLTFAKKAPELIQELLPTSATKASGDFGLSFKKRADSMLFGKPLSKGYDKAVGFLGNTAKGAALLPFTGLKRLTTGTISGIDAKMHGKRFRDGFNKNPGKAMQWINKQRETLTPEGYKAAQERREGVENVRQIQVRWNDGVKVAKKLRESGVTDWKGALDGKTVTNYEKIFKNSEFISTKIAVDRASKNEEKYRLIDNIIRTAKEGQPLGTRTIELVGENTPRTYNLDKDEEREAFFKDYEASQKTLKGAEENHAEMCKKHQDDAKTEKDFKFIKNNPTNPTDQHDTHSSQGI